MARVPRRIVTAQREDGTSYLARIEEIPEIDYDRPGVDTTATAYPGWADGIRPEVRVAWGREELPFELPVDPAETPSGVHPGPTGTRISVIGYPPGWRGEMFWSDRVDVLFILAGELTYRTDAGDSEVLRPGNVVIQNGTNKAFENHGTETVLMGTVMLGAVRVGPTPPKEQFHGKLESTIEER